MVRLKRRSATSNGSFSFTRMVVMDFNVSKICRLTLKGKIEPLEAVSAGSPSRTSIWQTEDCQILVRDGEPAETACKGSIFPLSVSRHILETLKSMTTIRVKENEPFDVALRRFKRTIEKLGLLTDLRAREFYEKPTTERKRKKAAAVKRHYKRVRSMQLPKKMY